MKLTRRGRVVLWIVGALLVLGAAQVGYHAAARGGNYCNVGGPCR